MSADAIARISPWVGIGVAFDYFLLDRLELSGSRHLIALCIALAIVGVIVRSRDASSARNDAVSDAARRALRTTVVLIPASIALVLLHARFALQGTPRATFVAAMIPVLLAWSVFLLLPLAQNNGVRGEVPVLGARARGLVVGIVAATIAALLTGTHSAAHWTSIDEVLYSMQAHLFVQGEYRWHLDPGVQRFFTLPLMVPTAEGPYSQYPPGYPAILAAFLAVGAQSASGAVLGALAVASTYLLGRRCASSFVGVVAAAMLATHFLFLEYSARYYSHVATMAVIASAAWLLHTPPSASRKRRVIECVSAGFLIGVAGERCATRRCSSRPAWRSPAPHSCCTTITPMVPPSVSATLQRRDI